MTKRQSVLAAAALQAKARAAEGEGPSNPAVHVLVERQSLMDEIAGGRRRDVVHRLVEPEKCRMWRRHNRVYDRLDERNCSDLIEQIAVAGQKIPALVRRLKDDPDGFEYEVICGARRHFAVSHLRRAMGRADLLYLIETRDLSDEEAFQLSDVENRTRRDISEFERACDYNSALAEYYGGNASRMAERIAVPRQTLNHYFALARLPKEIVAAYGDPTGIAVRHGTFLGPALNDPARAKPILEKARAIASEQERALALGKAYAYDAPTVFKLLKESAARTRKKASAKPEKLEVATSSGGRLMAIEKSSRGVVLRIPKNALDRKKELLEAFLKHVG